MQTKMLVVLTAASMMLAALVGRTDLRCQPLDKIGTTGGVANDGKSQTTVGMSLASASSFLAEREGFDRPPRCKSLRNRHFRRNCLFGRGLHSCG